MHEVGVAQTIIDEVVRRVREAGVRGRVRAVRLRLGRLSTIVPENLRFSFGVLAKDSELGDARLEIEEVPARARCRACGLEFELDEPLFLCEGCGSPALQMLSGAEMLIDSLDVEEP